MICASSFIAVIDQVRAPEMHDEIAQPEFLQALITFCFFFFSQLSNK